MTFRQVFHWKFLFHDILLPLLRRLPPARADATLGGLGRAIDVLRPIRRRRMRRAVESAKAALGAPWSIGRTRLELAANIPRYVARDGLLDGLGDEAALARFDLVGIEAFDAAMARGRGVILVGSHFGAHLAALHAIYRRSVPLRLLVQRPRHTSSYLQGKFDEDGPRPQARFFVQRGLTTGEAAERILMARAALRDGMAVYLNGDIPWTGPNTREGRLLGRTQRLLTLWADLAVLTHAPVVLLFAAHRPGGRFALTFDPPAELAPGDEPAAFARFLVRLEAEIVARPADAIPHLLWPSFNPA